MSRTVLPGEVPAGMEGVVVSMRTLMVAVGLVVGLLVAPAGAASAQGATTIDCSTISQELGGTIVITPQGDLLANCWHHELGSPGEAGGTATLVDCSDALGIEGAIGIQVITPTGGVFTNCLVHFLN